MKAKNIAVGMEVKLRKDITKCFHTDGSGQNSLDCDLVRYKGGDVVTVLYLDSDGWVRVDKENAIYVWVDAKHLRKIK